MAYAQMSYLSSTKGRLLEGEKGFGLLVHVYHSTLLISFLSLFSPFFVTLILSHSFLSFSMLARVVL